MTSSDPDARTRELALAALAQGEPAAWFERLYVEAAAGTAVVPWDLGTPQAALVEWAKSRSGDGRTAIVVGCGLGRDAEFIVGLGYATTAFDLSETAVRTARARYPDSAVEYVAADLLDPPAAWRHGFDLVVENLTVQSMVPSLRERATRAVGELVAPGGTLVVSAACRADDVPVEQVDGPPWPLSEAEVAAFAVDGLTTVSLERQPALTPGGNLRWLAEFRR